MDVINVNKCDIIITKGKNTGLTCGSVNKRCRHRQITCIHCDNVYTTDTSLYNHQKICKSIDKIRPIIKCKNTTVIDDNNNEDLEQKLKSLELKLKDLEDNNSTHTVNNINTINNTVNISLTTIDNSDVLEKLMSKMGEEEALKFLLEITSSNRNQLMCLIEKLYLTGDPNNYPIANKDGKIFRFRDNDHRIIHDVGGNKIIKLSTNIHSNIYAGAANLEAHRLIENGDDNANYNNYRLMQECASNNSHDMKSFVKDLASKTFNMDHYFFAKGTQVVIDDD